MYEVRGSGRIEQHNTERQKSLQLFGFDVETDVDGMTAFYKDIDGRRYDDR